MDWHATMPFAALLEIEAVSHRPEEVRARLAWREELCTADGVLHGGAVMALADSAGAVCAFLNLPDGATGTATIQSSTSFLLRRCWAKRNRTAGTEDSGRHDPHRRSR